MHTRHHPKTTALQLGIILWAALCIFVFMRYPASKSTIHESVLGSLPLLLSKIARINRVDYYINLARSLAGILLFIASCLGVGWPALVMLAPGRPRQSSTALSWMATGATAFVIGQAFLSLLFFTLAELHQLRAEYVAIAGVAAITFGVWRLRAGIGKKPLHRILELKLPEIADGRVMLLLAALAMVLSVGYSAAQISYDATSLYFSDAKLSALTHTIAYFIQDPFVASIFLTGINYAAIIQVFGDQAARLYSWASGLAIIALAVATAEALEIPKRARLILLAMILSSTAIFDLLGDGKIDLAATAPVLAAVYWVLRAPAGTHREHLLIGFLAGMAMAARPYNILLVPTIILFLISQDTMFGTEDASGKRLSNLFEAVIWIAIGASPWLAYILVTNWIIVGDPVAFIKSFLRLRSGAYPLSFPADSVWANRLLYPFSVTYINHGQSLGNISPLFLGLLPLGLWSLVRRRIGLSKRLRFAIFAAVGTLLVWLVVTSMVFEIRYVIFLWVVFFMPVAVWAAAALEAPDPLIRALVRLAVVIMLLFVIVRTVYISVDTYAPVDEQGNAHCYYFEKCAILQTVNQVAQPGERVLMLNAFRYYLRKDLFACSTRPMEYQSLQQLSRTDSVEFWAEAYREGNTLLVYQADYVLGHLYLGMLPSPANAPPWLHLEPIAGNPGDELVIYRITAVNPPNPPESYCEEDASGIWQIRSTTALTRK